MFKSNDYNPDVLSCLANLSSDEVFTPPQLANEILDLLPKEIWKDKNTKFLDPVCKSGVFLREIAKRLNQGLEKKIANKQKRIDHIFKNQLFGIGITELTSLLSRRSLYCSKTANGNYSVCESFDHQHGNIKFKRIEHTWEKKRCKFCGANQEVYDRGGELETHAYQFIHTKNPREIFNMKFDVVIGNPPYQLNDGGGSGSSAKPIYNYFVTQAKKLKPRYLTMIIPSRWFSGGKGLDTFRKEMLTDSRIRHLVDYTDSRDCFPGVDIAGGICYFLWERENRGDCRVTSIHHGQTTVSERPLDEFDTFIRYPVAAAIVKKIQKKSTLSLNNIVSSRNPFSLDSKVRPTKKGDLEIITSGGKGAFPSSKINSGRDLVDKWKVLLSKASHDHGGQPDKDGRRRIFSRIEVIPPHTVSTDSYLIIGPFDNKKQAENMALFLRSKFCRFLVSTVLMTQNIAKDAFRFVPIQDVNKTWTDEKLYKTFRLTKEEINFIDSMVGPMKIDNE